MNALREYLETVNRAIDANTLARPRAACEVGERLCRELSCDRASIWMLRGARVMRLGGFDLSQAKALSTQVEFEDERMSVHLVAERKMGVYPSPEPQSDFWLEALRERYLKRNGIESLPVAAIGTNPHVSGFACAASLTPRNWSQTDLSKLRLVANAIALRRARRAFVDKTQVVLAETDLAGGVAADARAMRFGSHVAVFPQAHRRCLLPPATTRGGRATK